MTALPSPSPHVQAFREKPIGWIVLNRPERRNALNGAMWDAIPPVARALDRDGAVRALVLRGAGSEAFAAGADISEFAENRGDSTAARDYEHRNAAAFAAIRGTAKPTVAMIAGFCIGGGLALALACDLRLAAENAVFSLPPARLGLAYPIDGLRDLLAAVSPAVAKDLIFPRAGSTRRRPWR